MADAATCKGCYQTKKGGNGCIPHTYQCDGKAHVAVLYGDEREGYQNTGSKPAKLCHDCHAPIGKPHHVGCDIERCPICSKQLTTCGCSVKINWATPPVKPEAQKALPQVAN